MAPESFDPLEMVLAVLCEISGRDRVDPDAPLATQGIDSLSAVTLSSRLSSPKKPLSPTVVFSHPTARALAALIDEATPKAGVHEPVLRAPVPSETSPITVADPPSHKPSNSLPTRPQASPFHGPFDSPVMEPLVDRLEVEEARLDALLERLST
ncbi:MAG: acyl carrier protein [Pseudomonadota bacterium]